MFRGESRELMLGLDLYATDVSSRSGGMKSDTSPMTLHIFRNNNVFSAQGTLEHSELNRVDKHDA